ncbi:sodium-coupled monocarboxylate transporter 1-like isoform X2 [Pomacea canaliculata]|uniref:sodium-coupled monocarboxylate transporter 1-like isoform X2 n=1 Tax=Pomacea canaliculata TaxID=400727 RepID=UPI000D72F325|nr:sodium-coupled monocarboxylate transporter 1-like isoform X2 [Pomacea canaliculata]
MSTNTFSIPDYVVFAAMLAVSAGIGVYYACAGGRQRSTREFLMADNSMRYLPLSLSVLASFFSASTLLGTPAEIYQFGAMYWISVVGACLAPITGALLFGPMFFKIKVISVFESVGMGIVLFGPSTALSAVTGLSEWVIVVLVGMVCTFYTTLGGLKAVVWTDVFQTLVMLTGMLTVLIKASIELGGMDEVWRACERGGRLHFFDFDPDPRIRHTFWGLTLGIFLIWLPPYAVDQQMVQRFSSARSLREAKIALLLNAPGMFIIITLCSLTGLVLYAQYADCDPLRDGKVQNPNQLLPYFVVGVLGHLQGMSGLFVASLFSGALSSVSSMMNSLAAVTWEDFLKLKLGHLSDETAAKVTKLLVLLYGGLGVGLAFLVKELGGTVLQASLTLNGAAGAPLVGLFILGAAFTSTNWIGALAGGILGLTFSVWLSVGAYVSKPLNFKLPTSLAGCNATGNNTYVLTTHLAVTSTVVMTQAEGTYSPSDPRQLEGLNNLYGLSYLWFSGLGIATTVICGLVVSWLTGSTKSEDVKEDYQLQVFRKVTSCRACYLSEDYNVTTDVHLNNLTEEENWKAEGHQKPSSGDVEPNNHSTNTSPRRTTCD